MANATGARKNAEAQSYVLIAILVSILFLFVLPMPLSRLDVAYTFSGDAVDKLVQIKNVAETGWLFFNDRLGYPFAYDRLDFPRFDSLNYAIMGPIAAVTGEAGLAMNLYYLASFYLIAFSAFWTLRRLTFDTAPAVICALVFAFLPYHLFRGVAHLTNGTYFLIPPAVLILFWAARDQMGFGTKEGRRRLLFALLVAVLITLQTPYNGVFFSILSLVAAAIAFSSHAKLRNIGVVCALLMATAGTFVAEQVPRLIHQAQNGTVDSGTRSPSNVQYYSTNLTQIVLPSERHRLAPVRERARIFNQEMQVPQSEVRHQYIGVLGLIGLATLFLALSRRSSGVSKDVAPLSTERTVAIAALLAVALLVFTISTGLGTIFSYYFAQSIRALNRTLPFFAFLCLIGSAWALQLVLRRFRRDWLRRGIAVLLGAAFLFDAVPLGMARQERDAPIASYDAMKRYFAEMEGRLGGGAAVFQMPVTWYPEHPPIQRTVDYDYLKPFLLTDTLRFSAGASRGREGYNWGRFVEQQPPTEMIASTHAAGFGAILIDGFGYTPEDLSQLTAGLTQALPEEPFVSEDQRWWTFPLAGCCGGEVPQIRPGERLDVYTYAVGSGPIRFSNEASGSFHFDGGWNRPESWGTWSGGEAALRFHLTGATGGALSLEMETRMLLGPNIPERSLLVECNGVVCGEFVYGPQAATQRLDIALAAGTVGEDGRLEIRFRTRPEATPQSAGVNSDTRAIGMGIHDLAISTAQ
ncbi:hypothetical protein [Aureimonas mangrovi]|uniref:hypothetical protein n=1 Tax=Aureimonas mangrovi TaxID=2758041 RepID=UPI00163D8EC3|nr:hypothetical protein [Aureimonas mangrovi]